MDGNFVVARFEPDAVRGARCAANSLAGRAGVIFLAVDGADRFHQDIAELLPQGFVTEIFAGRGTLFQVADGCPAHVQAFEVLAGFVHEFDHDGVGSWKVFSFFFAGGKQEQRDGEQQDG